MSVAETTAFKRNIVDENRAAAVCATLQSNLTNLVDLALLMKQAHWNVVGPKFRSIHLQLDEIIADVRDGSDEIAERIVTLGIPADGRVATVLDTSVLETYPYGLLQVKVTISLVADALQNCVAGLREAIAELGSQDPISEDLCISVCRKLEKHLWMMQSQEIDA